MKKKCAVFTICKNEDYFLPKWIKHYKKYFDNSDIYILDHQSNDGSTLNLDVNVILVENELAFDHNWLLNVVESFQRNLLENYESVLFAEADELLYCLNQPLNEMIDDFLLDDESKYVTAHGFEIKHQEHEPIINSDDEIIKNRNYWFSSRLYTKTLLSKIPLNWVWGFHYPIYDKSRMYEPGNGFERHHINQKTNEDYNLYLIHLHRCDFDLMFKRHEIRSKWNQKYDGGGNHNRTSDIRVLYQYFNDTEGADIVEIPEPHKKHLYGI
jgi:hypothetical protein